LPNTPVDEVKIAGKRLAPEGCLESDEVLIDVKRFFFKES